MEYELGKLATDEQARWEGRQKALAEVATWPASQEAERLLMVTNSGIDPDEPALLNLLGWAIDEAPSLDLDPGMAPDILQELLYVSMRSSKIAVLKLLRVNNPEEEVPAQLLRAETWEEAAAAMLSLANEAVDKSPWA